MQFQYFLGQEKFELYWANAAFGWVKERTLCFLEENPRKDRGLVLFRSSTKNCSAILIPRSALTSLWSEHTTIPKHVWVLFFRDVRSCVFSWEVWIIRRTCNDSFWVSGYSPPHRHFAMCSFPRCIFWRLVFSCFLQVPNGFWFQWILSTIFHQSLPGGCVFHHALALHAAAIPGLSGVTACHRDLLVPRSDAAAHPAAGPTLQITADLMTKMIKDQQSSKPTIVNHGKSSPMVNPTINEQP